MLQKRMRNRTRGGFDAEVGLEESSCLRSLRPGERGVVTGLPKANGSARRLAEFGLVRGATVEMIRPGSPCIVRIENTRLSVGAALQSLVCVLPVE